MRHASIPNAADLSGRLDAVHCLRGLAALSVCLLHISVATLFVFPPSIQAVAWLGGFGVPMFFLISGFVVPLSLLGRGYSIRAFPRFVARRIVRLDPPYFAALGLALLLALVRTQDGATFPYHASDVALHVGYLSGLARRPWIVSVFWTLGIEFQYYLGVGLVVAAMVPLRRHLTTPAWTGPIMVGLLLAGTFLLRALELQVTTNWGAQVWDDTWMGSRHAFLLGMAALVVRRFRLSLFWVLGVATIVFGWNHMLTWLAVHQWPDWSAIRPGVVLTGIAAAIVLAPTHWPWLRHLGRPLAGLGTISYSLYVTHPLLVGMVVARLVVSGWMPNSSFGLWCVFGAELAMCLGFATGFYLLVERPGLRWSRLIRITSATPRPAPPNGAAESPFTSRASTA